ncbi:MAG: zinc-ribbon domain-containing protein [Lachnospiraceae bacterium]|nr:zinc-ribbon domain-containing protein [Lachnospiraceae bacterium]
MAFYDGLGKKIQKTGQDALEKTKGAAETARLNAAISDLEKEINNTFADLGRSYYNKHAQSIEDQEFLPYFRKIEDRMEQIQRNRNKIRALKGLTKCIHCGQDIEINAVFCNHCGQRQVEAANVGQTASRCSNCGAPITAGQLFCTGCGQRIEAAPQVQAEKRFCVNCGQELAPGAVFCTRCGQRNQEEPSAPAGGMNAAISAEMMGTGQPAPEPDYYAEPAQQDPDIFAEESYPAEEPRTELYSEEPVMPEPAEPVAPEPDSTWMPEQAFYTQESDAGSPMSGGMENVAAQPAQAAAFCTSCGSQLDPDEIFCSNCGARVR